MYERQEQANTRQTKLETEYRLCVVSQKQLLGIIRNVRRLSQCSNSHQAEMGLLDAFRELESKRKSLGVGLSRETVETILLDADSLDLADGSITPEERVLANG